MAGHITGIDWLRAILSVCVVLWHLGGAGRSLIFDDQQFRHHVFTGSDLVNFHLLLLAVPSFILTSCFLYARSSPHAGDARRRLRRLALLAVFWTVVFHVWFGGYQGLLKLVPHSGPELVEIVVRSGRTIYYFFVSLALATLVTHGASRVSTAWNVALLAGASGGLFVLPAITVRLQAFPLSAYWNPLNFLPYPFAAVLLHRACSVLRESPLGLCACVLTLGACATGLGWYEWTYDVDAIFFPGQGYAIPGYTRLSLVCSCSLLLLLALIVPAPGSSTVRFMAKHSLALYCLHPLFIGVVGSAVVLDAWSVPAERAIELLIVVGICYVASMALAPFIDEDLIR